MGVKIAKYGEIVGDNGRNIRYDISRPMSLSQKWGIHGGYLEMANLIGKSDY